MVVITTDFKVYSIWLPPVVVAKVRLGLLQSLLVVCVDYCSDSERELWHVFKGTEKGHNIHVNTNNAYSYQHVFPMTQNPIYTFKFIFCALWHTLCPFAVKCCRSKCSSSGMLWLKSWTSPGDCVHSLRHVDFIICISGDMTLRFYKQHFMAALLFALIWCLTEVWSLIKSKPVQLSLLSS